MKFQSKQEIMNHVVDFFKEQRRPGYENFLIKYKNSRGHCCAIGCLISSSESLERLSDFHESIFNYCTKKYNEKILSILEEESSSLVSDHLKFIHALQQAHDTSVDHDFCDDAVSEDEFNQLFMKRFEENLRRLSTEYELLYEGML